MLTRDANRGDDQERSVPYFEGLEARLLLTTLNVGEFFVYRNSNGHLVRAELGSVDVTGLGRETNIGQVEIMKWVAGNVADMPGRVYNAYTGALLRTVVPDMFGEGITGGWLDGNAKDVNLESVTAMAAFSATSVWVYDRAGKTVQIINPTAATIVPVAATLRYQDYLGAWVDGTPNIQVFSMASAPGMLFIWGTMKYMELPAGATTPIEVTVTGIFRYDVVGNVATIRKAPVPGNPNRPCVETTVTPLPILTYRQGVGSLYGTDGTSLYSVDGIGGGGGDTPSALINYSTLTPLQNVTGLSMHDGMLYIAADGDKVFSYPWYRPNDPQPYAKWIQTTGRTHGPSNPDGTPPGAVHGLVNTGTVLYDFVRLPAPWLTTLLRTVNAHATPNADVFSIYVAQADRYANLTVTPISEDFNDTSPGVADILLYDDPASPPLPDFQRPLTAAMDWNPPPNPRTVVDVWAPAGSGATLIGGVPVPTIFANPEQNTAVGTVGYYTLTAGAVGVFPGGALYAGIALPDATVMDMGRILVAGSTAGRVNVTGSLDVLETGHMWGDIRVGYDANNLIVHTDYAYSAPAGLHNVPIVEFGLSNALVETGGTLREINVGGNMYGEVNAIGGLNLQRQAAPPIAGSAPYADYNNEPIWEMEHKRVKPDAPLPGDPFFNPLIANSWRRHWTTHAELITMYNDLVPNPPPVPAPRPGTLVPAAPPMPPAPGTPLWADACANAQYLYYSNYTNLNHPNQLLVWGMLGVGGFYLPDFPQTADIPTPIPSPPRYPPPISAVAPSGVLPEDQVDTYAMSMMAGQTIVLDARTALLPLDGHMTDPRLGLQIFGAFQVELYDAGGRLMGSVGYETVEDYRGGARLGNGVTQEPLTFTAPQAGLYYIVVTALIPADYPWSYTLFIDNATRASLGAVRVKGNLAPAYTLAHDWLAVKEPERTQDIAVQNGSLGAVEVTGTSSGTRTLVVGNHDLVSFRAAAAAGNVLASDSNIGLVQTRTGNMDATIVAGARDDECNDDAYIQNVFCAGALQGGAGFLGKTEPLAGLWSSGSIGVVEVGGTVWGSVDFRIDGNSTKTAPDPWGGRLDMLHVGGDWGGLPPIGIPTLTHIANSDIGAVKVDGIIWTLLAGDLMPRPLQPVSNDQGALAVFDDDGGARLQIRPGLQIDPQGKPIEVPSLSDPTKMVKVPSRYEYYVFPVGDGQRVFGEGGPKIGGVLMRLNLVGPVTLTNTSGSNVLDIGHLELATDVLYPNTVTTVNIAYGGPAGGSKGGVNVYYVHGTNVDSFVNTSPGGSLTSGDFTTSVKRLEVAGDVGHILGAAREWVPGVTAAPANAEMGWYAGRINGVQITGTLGQARIGGWLGDLLVSGRADGITVDSDRATAPGRLDGVKGVVHTGDLGTIDVGDGLLDDGSGAWPEAAILSDLNIQTVSILGKDHVLNGAVLAVGLPAGMLIPGQPEPAAAIQNVVGTGGALCTALIASPAATALAPALDHWRPSTGDMMPSGWVSKVSFSGSPTLAWATIDGTEVFGANIGTIEAKGGSNGIDYSFFTGARVAANLAGVAQVLADGPGLSNSLVQTNGGRIGNVRGTDPKLSDVRSNYFDSTSGMDEVSGRNLIENTFWIPGTIGLMKAVNDISANIGGTIGSILNLQTGKDFAGNNFTIASHLQSARIGGDFRHSTLNLHGPEGAHLGLLDVKGSISGTITVAGVIDKITCQGTISATIRTELDPDNPISPDIGEISTVGGYTGVLNVTGNLGKFTTYSHLGINPQDIPNHVPQRIEVKGNVGTLRIVMPKTKGAAPTNLYSALYIGGNFDTLDVDGELGGDVTVNGYLKNLIIDGDMGHKYPDYDGDGNPDIWGNVLVYGAIDKITLAPGASIIGNLTTGATLKSLDLSDKDGDPAKGNIEGNVTTLNGAIEKITVTGGSITGNLTAGGKIGKVTVKGTKGTAKTPGERGNVTGDIVARRGGIDALTITDGDLLGNVDAQGGDLLLLSLTNGNTQAGKTTRAYGSIGSLVVKNGKMAANVEAGVRLDKLDLTGAVGDPDALTGNLSVGTEAKSLKVKGNINGSQLDFYGTLTALGVTGDLNNVRLFTYGDMGDIAVGGTVRNSQIIGGYKDIAAPAPDLVHRANLKSISAGNWDTSTIALGVDPVNGTFGDGDDVPAPGTSTLGKITLKNKAGATAGRIITDSGVLGAVPPGFTVVRVAPDPDQPPLDVGGIPFDKNTKLPMPDGTLIKYTGAGRGSYFVTGIGTARIVVRDALPADKLDVSRTNPAKPDPAKMSISVRMGDDRGLSSLTFKGTAALGDLEIDGDIGTISAAQVNPSPTWDLPGIIKTVATPGVDGAKMKFGTLGAWKVAGSLTNAGTPRREDAGVTADIIGDLQILGNTKAKPVVLGNLNVPITATLGGIKNLVITGDVGAERPTYPVTITAHSGLAAFSARNVYGDILVEKGDIGKFAAFGNVGCYNDDDSATVGNVEALTGYIKSISITNGTFGPPNTNTAIRSLTGIGSYSLQGPKGAAKRPSSGGVISTNGAIGSITVTNATMSSRVRASDGIKSIVVNELQGALLTSGGDIGKIVVKETDPKNPSKGDVTRTYIIAGFDPSDAGFVYRTNVPARDVFVSGTLAYVAGGNDGLQIFDVTNPFAPQHRGGYDTTGEANAVYVLGNLAYVADGTAGLQIFDVTNPAAPARVGGFDTPGEAFDVYVSGNLAYVADGSAGLEILDVTNPAAPTLQGSYDTTGQATGLWVAGNTAYVADGTAGLQIIDVTNPAAPALLGGYDTPGTARGVAVLGNLAYVADGTPGLRILDVTNPAAPVSVSAYKTSGQAYDVAVLVVADSDGNPHTLAYVAADYEAGLQLIDVTDPAVPQRKASYTASRHGWGLAVSAAGDTAYLADQRAGLQIIHLDTDLAKPSLNAPERWGAPDLRQDDDNVRIDGQSTAKMWQNFDGDITNDTPNADRLSAGSVLSVEVAGDMSSSSIVAGAGPGVDGYYGRADAQQVSATGWDAGADDQVRGAGYVRKVVIGGQLDGSPSTQEHYGILAASGDILPVSGKLPAVGVNYVKFDSASPLRHITIGALTTWGGNPKVAGVQTSDNELAIRFTHPIDFSTIVTPQTDPTQLPTFTVVASVDSDFTTLGDNTTVTGPLAAGGLDVILRYDEKMNAVVMRLRNGSWASAGVGTNFLVVLDSDRVLDRHGNKLDGQYLGWFPSGDGMEQANEPDFTYRLTYGDPGDNVGSATDLTLANPPVGTPGTPPFAAPPILWHNQVLTIDGRLGDNAGNPLFDVDWFRLAVQPGDVVYAWTSSPVLYGILPGTATLVGSPSGFGYQATTAGTVYVEIAVLGYTGPYNINILRFNDGNSNFGFVPNTVHVAGNLAYVANGNGGIQILDVTVANKPVLVGGFETTGKAYGVYASGNYAYVADGQGGLQITDVTDPANPVRKGGYDADASGIYVSGNLAYVADGTAGLQILDVTNPANPVRRSEYGTPGEATGVFVSGNLAYVADGTAGLQVLDVTDPANPALRGNFDTAGEAYGVCVVGNLAYVADGTAGLQILDVTNPAAPVLRGAYDTPGTARSVSVVGNLAYVADGQGGVQVIDVTDPTKPVLEGRIDTPGEACGVYVSGNLAYVADGMAGLRIVDVAKPAKPVFRGVINIGNTALGVYVVGNRAYVSDGQGGMQVVDVADPANPVLRGGLDTPGTARGVYVSGNLAYVADGQGGVRIIDVTDPANPVLQGGLNTMDTARGVYVSGNLAYLADGTAGLQILDVTDPANPVFRGTYDTAGTAQGVYVAGNLAYVADGTTGLQILDVTDPASPALRGNFDTAGEAYGVCVVGNTAYVADGTAGLQILNVTNPAVPVLLGIYNTPGTAWSVSVVGNLAYVADGIGGVQIVDVTNPAAPVLWGTYATGGEAYGVYASGSLAYVLDSQTGRLQIIDATNPVLLGGYDTTGTARAVYVAGNMAYVADGSSGLQIIDVTHPDAPLYRGGYDTAGEAYGVYVAGNLAYVADDTEGLQVINVTNPANPVRRGTYNTPGAARGVYVVPSLTGAVAYVADGTAGLQIIDVPSDAAPALLGTYNTTGTAQGVYVVTYVGLPTVTLAYVADGASGLQIINVTNPAAPVLVGTYNTPGTAQSVYVATYVGLPTVTLAYVADGASGIQIIDVTTPAAPVLRGVYDTPGTAQGVAVGAYAGPPARILASVADGTAGGLQRVDVTTPAVPVLRSGYDTAGEAYGVYTSGGLAYVADGTKGLQIFDVRIPALRGGYAINANDNTTQHPTVLSTWVPTPDGTGLVAQPDERDQEILAPDDVDVFALGDPDDPTTILPKYTRLTLTLDTALIGSRMTPKMAVFNSQGNLVDKIFFGEEPVPQTDIGKVNAGLTLTASVVLPADDHYYVAVSGMVPRAFDDVATSDRDIGRYQLTVTKTPPPPPPYQPFPKQQVYLDFDGHDAQFLTDVFGNRTETRQTSLSAALFGFSPTYTKNLQLIVQDTIKQIFDNSIYKNIVFYTNPPSGDYTTIFIGGNKAPVANMLGVVEAVDSQNSNPHDDAVVFGGDVAALYNTYDPLFKTNPATDKTYTLEEIGRVLGNIAAHELGHLLGLQNVQNDFYYWAPPLPSTAVTHWLMGSDIGWAGRDPGYWAVQQVFGTHERLMTYPYNEFLIGHQNSQGSLWVVK